MKKSRMAVLTASVCVALSVSAFTLPSFASYALNTEQGKVKEKETPKEYMEDFNVQNTDGNDSAIFLTESQTQQLITAAEQAYKKELGIDIPEDLEFEYTANRYNPEDKTVYIGLTWSGRAAEQQVINFYATFESADFLNESATLGSISAYNGFDVQRLETFKKEGSETIKKELDMIVPDDYITHVSLSTSFVDGQQDTKLMFWWSDPKLDAKRTDGTPYSSKVFYTVAFDKVDLSNNTGRLSGAEKFYEFTQQSIMEERQKPGYIDFTDIQQNEMLETAKQFLAEKGIEIGNLRRSLQITMEGKPVMWFTFESMGLNDSSKGSVFVTVSPESKILGYSF